MTTLLPQFDFSKLFYNKLAFVCFISGKKKKSVKKKPTEIVTCICMLRRLQNLQLPLKPLVSSDVKLNWVKFGISQNLFIYADDTVKDYKNILQWNSCESLSKIHKVGLLPKPFQKVEFTKRSFVLKV